MNYLLEKIPVNEQFHRSEPMSYSQAFEKANPVSFNSRSLETALVSFAWYVYPNPGDELEPHKNRVSDFIKEWGDRAKDVSRETILTCFLHFFCNQNSFYISEVIRLSKTSKKLSE